ncbi:MAG: T9SS type A sorting domain-containing protein, partial [Saprospiraceae bacterium]|nr:T9SS type A sorting domain-containing protein [Saprospiraceae bacterium]
TPLDISIGGDTTGCIGSVITLFVEDIAGGPYLYNWSDGQVTPIINVLLTDTLEISVTVTNFDGCDDMATTTIYPQLVEVPEYTITPLDSINPPGGFCESNTYEIEIPDNYFTTVYHANGDLVSDSTVFEYTIPDSLSQDTLFIKYQGPTPYFCYGQDTLILEPYVPQLFDQDALELCLGSATISLNNSTPNDTILWSTGDTTTSIDIIVDQIATYSVTVTRGCTVVDSITIVPLPDIMVDLGPDQLFCEPISSSLSANASGGTPPFTYEWIASDGSQSDSATIEVHPILGDNEYVVIVTDSLGCSKRDTTNILLAPISSPIINSNLSCQGEIITLELIPDNYTEFLWSNGELGPVIDIIDPGTYCVTVTDINGCFAESCIDVVFEPLPDPVDIFCNATLTSIDFNWVNDPNLNYQIEVLTGQNGILNGSTFTVDDLTFGNSVTIELSIINAFGCVTTVSQTCTTQDCPDINIQITPVPDICLSANTTPLTLEAIVTGSIGVGMSSWSGPGIIDATNGIFDPLAVGVGSHTIVFTYEEGGCVANAAINIQIDEPILLPIISCAATTTSIEFAWNDVPGAAAYSVNTLSGPSGIMDGNAYIVEGLNPEEEVCIEVIADPATSCDPVSAQLCCTAEACPSVQIDVQDTYEICEDEAPFQISYTISGGNGTGTISWDGPCIDNNGVFDPSLCGPGVYTLGISYFEGPCAYQEPVVVFINQKPSSDFTISTSEVCLEEPIVINYIGNASTSSNFSWDFGGGNILVGQGFGPYEVQWNTTGTKSISLVVEENGCVSDTFNQQVDVIEAIETPIISCITTTSSIEFVWNPVVGAIEYEVSIDGTITTDTFTNFTVDGLNPDQSVDIQVTAITDNICGNTTAALSCITLPCPDITINLDTPYPTICLSDEDSPTDFLLSAVIIGGNSAGDELWSGPGIVDSLNGTFNPAEAGIGIHQITYTYTEDNCAYQENLTIEVTTEWIFQNINLVCSDDEETYSLRLDIITPDGVTPFQSEAVDNGDPLQVSIDNVPGCGTPFFYETTRECDCLTYAGTLDLAIDNLCGLPSIQLTHNGDDFLVEDDILRFILHSNNGNVLGEILAISETPSFQLEGDVEAGVTYYVSAVAGNTSSLEILNFDDPCLSVSPPQAVVFAEAIDLAVSQDTFICSGENYQLEATFNTIDSIVWSPTTALSCTDCPNPIAAPATSTTYTITAYNEAGCTEQDSIAIYVDEIPNFLPNELIPVCPSEYVDICLPQALAYEWNGPNDYFSIDQCLVWPDFDPIYGGTYSIEIQVSENCTITDQLDLFATPEQTINFLTPDFAACPYDVFTLSADIEGAISYRWYPVANVVEKDSANTLAFITTPLTFTLQTFDQFGCTAFFEINVTNPADCKTTGEIPLSDFTGGNDDTQQLAQHKNNASSTIRIFPNPSTNVFNISSSSIIQSIEVFHFNGQLVDQYQANERTYRVDANHWQTGTYLLRVKDQNGIHHLRVVKIQN